MSQKIRIGSRGSKLAVAQAEWVASELRKKDSSLQISFHTIVTTGDRDANSSLQKIGGKGVFVKEIEDALLKNEIDLAVHSMKDLPQMLPEGLILGPTPLRADPRDVWISRFGEQLHELPKHSTIGTGSPRRQAQIRHKYKKRDYRFEPIRGNVDTRLKKVQAGEIDAIVLAAAGLNRLGLQSEITQIIEPTEILPSPGQGCLGLEIRENDRDLIKILESIRDLPSDIAGRAERAFLLGIGGDCLIPLGAYSEVKGRDLRMRAILLDPSGDHAVETEQTGPSDAPELVGGQLAERLLAEGGAMFMSDVPSGRIRSELE